MQSWDNSINYTSDVGISRRKVSYLSGCTESLTSI